MAKSQGTFGNGADTQFDVNAGFSTAVVCVRLFDLNRDGLEIPAFQLQKQTPTANSVRFILTPAPASNSIQYVITDGTEPPDPA